MKYKTTVSLLEVEVDRREMKTCANISDNINTKARAVTTVNKFTNLCFGIGAYPRITFAFGGKKAGGIWKSGGVLEGSRQGRRAMTSFVDEA